MQNINIKNTTTFFKNIFFSFHLCVRRYAKYFLFQVSYLKLESNVISINDIHEKNDRKIDCHYFSVFCYAFLAENGLNMILYLFINFFKNPKNKHTSSGWSFVCITFFILYLKQLFIITKKKTNAHQLTI